MRVAYSERVQQELERIWADGVALFGERVAQAKLRRLHRVLTVTVAAQPYIGRPVPRRDVYRIVVPGTPFVVYYHVDDGADQITVLAVFSGRQSRAEFEPG